MFFSLQLFLFFVNLKTASHFNIKLRASTFQLQTLNCKPQIFSENVPSVSTSLNQFFFVPATTLTETCTFLWNPWGRGVNVFFWRDFRQLKKRSLKRWVGGAICNAPCMWWEGGRGPVCTMKMCGSDECGDDRGGGRHVGTMKMWGR